MTLRAFFFKREEKGSKSEWNSC